MAEITLCDLGFTKEELEEKLLARLVREVLTGISYDDEDGEYEVDSTFAKKVNALVKTEVDSGIERMAQKHLYPRINEQINTIVLAETNRWGERTKREEVTFAEYITNKADAWLIEPIDSSGKTQAEAGSYFRAETTRLAKLVEASIDSTVRKECAALAAQFKDSFETSIADAVKIKLRELQGGMTLTLGKK